MARTVTPIPSGESPDGTGGWPVLPQTIFQTRSKKREAKPGLIPSDLTGDVNPRAPLRNSIAAPLDFKSGDKIRSCLDLGRCERSNLALLRGDTNGFLLFPKKHHNSAVAAMRQVLIRAIYAYARIIRRRRPSGHETVFEFDPVGYFGVTRPSPGLPPSRWVGRLPLSSGSGSAPRLRRHRA